jgi:hypothetical protein
VERFHLLANRPRFALLRIPGGPWPPSCGPFASGINSSTRSTSGDYDLAVEEVDAAGELGHPRIEADVLAAVVGTAPQHQPIWSISRPVDLRCAQSRRATALAACRHRPWQPEVRAHATTVTMRPRRLSTPAIRPDGSGTPRPPLRHEHVLLAREIGKPDNRPPGSRRCDDSAMVLLDGVDLGGQCRWLP